MDARLATSVLASALVRLAEVRGGFGTILAKGDATAGSMLVILAERGRTTGILERLLQADGGYVWQDIAGKAIESAEETQKFLDRRRKFDPDLWLIELDVPSAERFAAEMNSSN